MNLPPIDTLTLQDARDEVARLRAELEQQRTRAEGAEQEKHDAMDDAAELTQSCKELEAKLAAARAHLAGVDVAELAAVVSDVAPGTWRRCSANDGSCVCGLVWNVDADCIVASFNRHEGEHGSNADVQDHRNADAASALRNAANALLAAAREVLS